MHFPSYMRHYIQERSFQTLKKKMPLKLENLTLDQQCFQRKILIKRQKCKKINKQKPQLNRMGRPEGGTLIFCNNSSAHKKKKDSFSFLSRTQPMKSHGLFVYYSLPNFLFTSIKVFFNCLAGTCTRLTMVADPELQFSTDPKQTHLGWRNIWQSIFFWSIT